MSENSEDLFGSISIDSDRKAAKPPEKKVEPARKSRKKPPARPPSRPRNQRRPRSGSFTILVVLAVLLGIYSAAGFLLVPYLVQNTLADYLADKAGLGLSVHQVRFNPFSFDLTAEGITAETREPGEAPAEFLSAGSIHFDLDLIELLRGDLVCSSMDIQRLNLAVIRRPDKRYNISYLFRGQGLRDHSEIIDFAELPFLFSFNNIRVVNSQVIFDDRSTGKEHRVEELELALPAISNFPYQTDDYIHPRFSAIVNGSPIKLTGEASLGKGAEDGRETRLSLDLDEIEIPLYFDYLPVELPVDISRGTVNGELQISFSPEEQKGSKLKIDFSLATDDLSLESRNGKLAVAVPTARIEGFVEPFNQNLHLQSILLREPVLTSEGEITRETLANLAPLTRRPGPEDPLHQAIPAISAKLLIADSGSLIIKKQDQKEPVRIWHSVQLSIKNFSNLPRTPEQEDSTFRLSGEHLASGAFFTWQGQFNDRNQPGGNLQLSNLPASLILPFLAEDAGDIKGTADLSGLLSLTLSEQGDRPFDYTLKSSTLSVKELHLLDRGVEWIHVPNLRCEPISRLNGVTDLGNVYLQNSFVTLYRNRLPRLFSSFNTASGPYIVHGIDFSGLIQVKEGDREEPLIRLSGVVLQANRLEQQEVDQENFVFSGSPSDSGSLKAKGILQLGPLRLNSQLSFENLGPAQVFSWFSETPTLTDSQAILNGTGTFRFPEQAFSGRLEATELIIGAVDNPVFRAARARFDDFSWSASDRRLDAGYLLVEEPEFSWNRDRDETNPALPVSVFLRHLFLPEPEKLGTDPDTALADFSLAIKQVDFSDGAVNYQDRRVSPPLALGLTGLNGSLNDLHYPIVKAEAAFSLTGAIEEYPFSFEGTGRLMQDPPSARTSFTAQQLPLRLFSRQLTGQLTGIDFDGAVADLSVTSEFGAAGQSREALLNLAELKPDKSGTPAATALALLTDPADNAILRLQATGTETAKPLLGEAIASLGTAIVKASINPILIAGEEYSDLASRLFIPFAPASAELNGAAAERLLRFSDLLASYPKLKLELTGYADTAIDTPVMLKALIEAEQQRTDQENQRRRSEWQQQHDAEAEQRRLDAALDGQQAIQESDLPLSKPAPFVPLLPKSVRVTPEMLEELALARETVVYDYLHRQLAVPETRLLRVSPRGGRVVEGGEQARVTIDLSDNYDLTNSGS